MTLGSTWYEKWRNVNVSIVCLRLGSKDSTHLYCTWWNTWFLTSQLPLKDVKGEMEVSLFPPVSVFLFNRVKWFSDDGTTQWIRCGRNYTHFLFGHNTKDDFIKMSDWLSLITHYMRLFCYPNGFFSFMSTISFIL